MSDLVERIADLSGEPLEGLDDPIRLEDVVADLWRSGTTVASAPHAPPTLAHDTVEFSGSMWDRCLVDEVQIHRWGSWPSAGRPPAVPVLGVPAIGVDFEQASALAAAQGGRLPSFEEWQQATTGAAPGNHGMRVGVPTASGVFPAARSGILDGWGNAWEWTSNGLVVGGSFASPAHPMPRTSASLVGFRIIR